jgi:hypothetical protein
MDGRAHGEVARIRGQELSGEIVGALEHDIGAACQVDGVVRQQSRAHDLHVGPRGLATECVLGGEDLVAPDVVLSVQDLAMEILGLDEIVIDEQQAPDACARKRKRRRAA